MLAERIDSWNEKLREEGRQKGRWEGRKEGLQEGRREARQEVLLRVLEKRFGPVDPVTRDRIATADADVLLEWIDRSQTTENLADVFSA